MSKAEDRALKAYPIKIAERDGYDENLRERKGFIKGYNQAVKDNELTIDDIMKLDALLIRSWNETKGNPDYEGVLNQFNNERPK